MAGFSGRGLAVCWGAVVSTVVVPWFPNNLARNSLARLSSIEIQSLVLQRLWRLLNCQANELRAKFPGYGRGEAVAGFFGRGFAVCWGAAVSMVVVSWFPNNLARNSLARLSNIEIQSLVLQRLWRLLKYQANELRAKFPGRGRGEVGWWDVGPLKTCVASGVTKGTTLLSRAAFLMSEWH